MLCPEERPEGTVRVHFADNTYKTVPLKHETTVGDVTEWLCRRASAGGRLAEPARHELLLIAPGSQALRERRLAREDRPLQIQEDSGAAAFKFLFREVRGAAGRLAAGPAPGGGDEDTEEAAEGAEEGGGGTGAGAPGGGAPEDAADGELGARLRRGRLRTGTLEQRDGAELWRPCSVILAEDCLWYSPLPATGAAGVGGGMASVALRDCDSVLEGEDKRQLQLKTKGGSMSFRAKGARERDAWLLAIVSQVALVKERDILLQAEKILEQMELKKSSQQLARAEEFGTLVGILRGPQQVRQLFFEFVHSEYYTFVQGAGGLSWPRGLNLESLLAYFQGLAEASPSQAGEAASSADQPSKEEVARAFAEGPLFARFRAHPAAQCRLCRIAAGIA